MSLRVLHSLFSVWRTICLSGCENPRSQLFYSHSPFWCLLSRETIMDVLECPALTRCICSCAHISHAWLCHVVPACILHPHTTCWTFSVACLHSLQLWSCLVWLNLASVDLVLNGCSCAVTACVPVLSFSLRPFLAIGRIFFYFMQSTTQLVLQSVRVWKSLQTRATKLKLKFDVIWYLFHCERK